MTRALPLVELPWHRDALAMLRAHRMVMLVGDPGSGKTAFAKAAAIALSGVAPKMIQGTPGTEDEHCWGNYEITNGESRFRLGPVATALQSDAWLIVEEFNLIPYEVRANLLGLRGEETIHHPITNEVFAIPPRFRLIATANPESMSCRRNAMLAQALLDDFMILEVPAPGPELVAKLLEAHFPRAPGRTRDRALELWTSFLEVRDPDEDANKKHPRIGFRAAAHLMRLLAGGEVSESKAIEIALVNHFSTDSDLHAAAKMRAALLA